MNVQMPFFGPSFQNWGSPFYQLSGSAPDWLLNNNTLFNNKLFYVCLWMVSFRVKVWVTCIVVLSNGIFRSQSKGRLKSCDINVC